MCKAGPCLQARAAVVAVVAHPVLPAGPLAVPAEAPPTPKRPCAERDLPSSQAGGPARQRFCRIHSQVSQAFPFSSIHASGSSEHGAGDAVGSAVGVAFTL